MHFHHACGILQQMKMRGPFLNVSLLVVLIGDSGSERSEDVSMVFVQDMINCFMFTHEIYNLALPIKICTTLLICLSSHIFCPRISKSLNML